MEVEKFLEIVRKWPSFAYLATPYSKYPDGIDEAFRVACNVTAFLIRNKIPVFSPIAHSHPVALHGQIDPLDHEIWMEADLPLMEAAGGLIIVKMPGWRTSYGIGEEIREFRKMSKPMESMEWPL